MQTAPATAARPLPRPAGAPARSIGAWELLDESEQLWLSDMDAALRNDPSPDSGVRYRLVLEALAAYVRLLQEHDRHAAVLMVFRRWPACTVVALARLAGAAGDRAALEEALSGVLGTGSAPASTWFAGWGECWQQLQEQAPAGRTAPYDAPGVSLLLHLSGVAAASDVAPELRLHLSTGALAIVFPGAPGCGARVEAGGECPVAEDRWVLPRPVFAANCFDVLGNVHRVNVVDPRDPLLVFDEDGTLIPDGAPLPAGDVWIVHLGEPPADAFDGPRHVVEEAAPPVGWSRWWLGRVSLASTRAVRSVVTRGGELHGGPWRTVASSERADLLFDDPVEGVLDRDGDVVYATPPRLQLPGGAADGWTIELRGSDTPTPQRWSAPGGTTVTLTERLPQPALGRFVVHAHAPGHRPVSGAFTMAGGVSLEATPRIRLLADGGLMPARILIRAPRGVQPTPSVVKISSTETSRDAWFRLPSGGTFGVRVEIPYCAVRKRTGSQTGVWGTDTQAFTLEDLDEAGAVDVRLPHPIVDEIGVPELLAAQRPDDPSGQRIRGRRLAGGNVYRYPLGSLTDAVRLNGTIALWLLLPGHDAHVGTVRGGEPASGVSVSGHRLVLQDRRARAQLTVRVCAPLAPWLEPRITTLEENSESIDLDGAFAGRSLLVTVADAGIELARWPRPGREHPAARTFRVAGAAALPTLDSRVRRDLAYYLAGRAPFPAGIADLGLVWQVAARATSLLKPGIGALTAQECAARLGATPIASLHAVTLDAETSIEPLIRSGLAAHGVRSVGAPAATAELWRVAPLAALLLTSPLLPYLADVPAWDPAELDAAEKHLLDIARVSSAPEVVALITSPERVSVTAVPPEDTPASEIGEALRDVLDFGAAAPQAPLFDAVRPRASGAPASALSLGCALVARIAAQGDFGATELERRLRHAWVEIAQREPGRAAQDLVEAEFAVSGWYAHHA